MFSKFDGREREASRSPKLCKQSVGFLAHRPDLLPLGGPRGAVGSMLFFTDCFSFLGKREVAVLWFLERQMRVLARKQHSGSLTFQERRDIFQLWHVVLPVATVFSQQGEVLQILSACVSRVEFGELPEYNAPSFGFFSGVLHPGNRLTARQEKKNKSFYGGIHCITSSVESKVQPQFGQLSQVSS